MLALCGMWSCGKKVPEEIIQPQAMENLLYDYHLATTMSADLPYDENYKKTGLPGIRYSRSME